MIEKGADVVVVGGGVIGCAVAGELARRGLAVTVIERGEPGRGASWAAGGMLSPYGEAPGGGPFLALSDESLRRYAAFADALLEETSIDVEYRASGKLHVSLGDDDAGLRAMADSADAAKFGVTLMDGAAARVLEPGLPEAVTTAVLVDRDYRVNNRRLADALPAAAIAAGAVLRTGDPVRAVWTERGAAAGVELLSGERIEAPHVVICAGAWSSELGGLPRPLPVRPMLGQMFAVNAAGRNPPERVLAARGCYIIPREDGRLVIGATVEDVGFRDGPTPRGISTLMAAAARLLPAVADLPLVESWSGFRPGTPDHLPIIGADPDVAGLFYATGHFRNGILLAPITAECIAELVTHGTPPLSLDAFKVEREWRVESGE